MGLADDILRQIELHHESLQTLTTGVPSGLKPQLAEVSSFLADCEAEKPKIYADPKRSRLGQDDDWKAAREAAKAAVINWRNTRTTAIDGQIAAGRAALQTAAERALPAVTELQVTTMVQRLAAFDAIEVDSLYASATEAERIVIERAAEVIGRQPRRRGDQMGWEPLLTPETVETARMARLQRADRAGAAALADLNRIKTTYVAVAGGAIALLDQA